MYVVSTTTYFSAYLVIHTCIEVRCCTHYWIGRHLDSLVEPHGEGYFLWWGRLREKLQGHQNHSSSLQYFLRSCSPSYLKTQISSFLFFFNALVLEHGIKMKCSFSGKLLNFRLIIDDPLVDSRLTMFYVDLKVH